MIRDTAVPRRSLESGVPGAHVHKIVCAVLGLWLAACVTTPTPIRPTATSPVIAPTPSVPPDATPTQADAATSLRVWLPPQFAPDPDTPAGQVLAEQLREFEQTHPVGAVEIRLKQTSGPGGLLESLTAAYNAAPDVLPDLIALTRDDLAAAAAAGLVLPLDDLVPPDTLADYYPFAQAMGRAQGAWVGLPFAADARVLAYRTDLYAAPPQTWTAVVTGTLIVPAAEASGLTVLHEYLALGGPLADPSGRAVLDTELLAEALGAFQEVRDAGRLPLSTLVYADVAATWQVFRERRAALAVTSAQWYLAEHNRAASTAAALIPTSMGTPFALADGWSWALVNTTGERRAAAAELLRWLTAPPRLASWTLAARVLPPRAEALRGWATNPLTPFAADVLTHAQLQPPDEVLAVVGPPLRQALDDVLNGRATPFAAAVSASQAVAGP
jgi:ABC-type glycerol-3-phosphate transport system substrate-binding protein